MATVQYSFGLGNLWVIPEGATPTPTMVGTIQEVTLDIERSTKELYGENTFPEDVAATTGKVSGKFKQGRIQSKLLAGVYGVTPATGQRIGVPVESTGTISGATYTAANATGFQNHQVRDENGNVMERTASGPSATQYSVTAGGVYTFNAGATGKVYSISYSHTVVGGFTTTVTNELMGTSTYFKIELYNSYGGNKSGFTLFRCIIPKISLPMKNEDYTLPEMDFSAMADPNTLTGGKSTVFSLYTAV
jgi:hypothetical protein